MFISSYRRIDTVSFPGLYLSTIEVSPEDDVGGGVNVNEVSNTVRGDKDSLDGILLRGKGADILSIDGIHKLIRTVRAPHMSVIGETDGRAPAALDDLIGAGYITGVSFTFDRGIDSTQLESLDVAKSGCGRYAATITMDPSNINLDDAADICEEFRGALWILLKNPAKGVKGFRKSELTSFAKSLRGVAKEVRVV